MHLPSTLLRSFLRNLTVFQKFSLGLHTLSFVLYLLGTFINQQLLYAQNIASSDSYQTLQYIVDSLSKPPLASLTLITDSEACPLNSSIITLMSWIEPDPACSPLSSASQNTTKSSSSSSGRAVGAEKGCSGNKRIESPITSWKLHRFCAQYLKRFMHVSKDLSCPENFIRCSETLCASREEPCPITDIILDYTHHSQDAEAKPRLDVVRNLQKDPINALEVSLYPNSCYQRQDVFSDSLNELKTCNRYGEDKTAQVLSSQELDTILEENGIDTSLQFNDEGYQISFLIAKKSVIEEGNSTGAIALKGLEQQLNKTGSLNVIALAFTHTEFLLFIMLFFMKHQFLINLLLLYCALQICIGIYGAILIHSFNKIRASVAYLFLSSPPTLSSEGLDLAIKDTKYSIDAVLDVLQLLSAWIIILSLVRLVIFLAFVKLRTRLINYPGSGVRTLEVSRHQEAVGILVSLLPVAGRHPWAERDRFEREEGHRAQEVELEPLHAQNVHGKQRNESV